MKDSNTVHYPLSAILEECEVCGGTGYEPDRRQRLPTWQRRPCPAGCSASVEATRRIEAEAQAEGEERRR